jgi:hypothetical protein
MFARLSRPYHHGFIIGIAAPQTTRLQLDDSGVK